MNTEYTQRLEKIEAVLDSLLPEKPNAAWMEKIFNLTNTPELAVSLIEPGRDLLKRGGKRWRPLLMLLIAESLGGKDHDVLPLTPLVEFCHNASLIHDDIEDNSDERRGKPAVHLLYGNDTAINSGAFLYFLPLVCISSAEISGEVKSRVFEVWGEHLRRLHLGQSLDIAWHRDYRALPKITDYELMCRLKTGGLARMAAELGVYSVKPQDKSLAADFGTHAESLGYGFQILDDVKNLRTGIPGKKRGDDITEGKKSLPVLLFLHRYPEKLDFTVRCFNAARSGGVSAPEVEDFIQELEKNGILGEAYNLGLTQIEKAGSFLNEKSTLLAGFKGLIA